MYIVLTYQLCSHSMSHAEAETYFPTVDLVKPYLQFEVSSSLQVPGPICLPRELSFERCITGEILFGTCQTF